MPDLPPESAAAHFEAIGKAINDIDVIVTGPLRGFRPPSRGSDSSGSTCATPIDMSKSGCDFARARHHGDPRMQRKLKQVLEVANVQTAGGS
jgi:hypothetical protein